ncbi:hypothetical protein [Thiolapillus sp.]|uniref:hypothetical protein n=1 Tax=Thiolapillus sp. TaxID=2017437 RepID=UPI003AF41157
MKVSKPSIITTSSLSPGGILFFPFVTQHHGQRAKEQGLVQYAHAALLEPLPATGEDAQIQQQARDTLTVEERPGKMVFHQVIADGQHRGHQDESHAPEKGHLEHQYRVAQRCDPNGREKVLVTEYAAIEYAEKHG